MKNIPYHNHPPPPPPALPFPLTAILLQCECLYGVVIYIKEVTRLAALASVTLEHRVLLPLLLLLTISMV